jgi:ABC-2 type transport system ATP-binding protein
MFTNGTALANQHDVLAGSVAEQRQATAPMIETLALTKRFPIRAGYAAVLRLRRRSWLTAVDQVSLTIRRGELFGLLGPNGAGKTTLIKLLCTLVLPTAGAARVAGLDVVRDAAAVRRTVGLVACDERSFYWRLSGRQNLEFFATLVGLRQPLASKRIADVLAISGLSEHADRQFMSYSTGMRQRLAIARGLLAMPELLILDEPTRSLDPLSAYDLRQFVRRRLVDELGRTVVLVTHQLGEAEELCDRIAVMDRGQLIACGTAAQIKQQVVARERYTLDIRGLPPEQLLSLAALPGVAAIRVEQATTELVRLQFDLSATSQALPAVIRQLVDWGGDVLACQHAAVSLEDAFLQVMRATSDGRESTGLYPA